MEWAANITTANWVGLIQVTLFVFIILLGFPMAFTLLAMSVIFGYYAFFDAKLFAEVGVFALTYAGYFYAKKAWIVHETSWNSPAQIQVYFSKSLIPIAGLLLVIIGISEIFRCFICIKDGKWPERINDVEETEKMILRKIQKGESVKGLV